MLYEICIGNLSVVVLLLKMIKVFLILSKDFYIYILILLNCIQGQIYKFGGPGDGAWWKLYHFINFFE